jgi:hypothetical protein
LTVFDVIDGKMNCVVLEYEKRVQVPGVVDDEIVDVEDELKARRLGASFFCEAR